MSLTFRVAIMESSRGKTWEHETATGVRGGVSCIGLFSVMRGFCQCQPPS